MQYNKLTYVRQAQLLQSHTSDLKALCSVDVDVFYIF